MVNSHKSQHPAAPKLIEEALITSLQGEVSSNVIKYVGFLNDNSSLNLFSEMKWYVKWKVYDTLFGDAVPLILANVLQMNIILIIAENSTFDCHIVEYESNIAAHIENSIFVYKVGEHHNAIVPLAPRVSANSIASRHELLRSIPVNGKTCVDKNSDMITFFAIYGVACVELAHSSLGDWKGIFIAHPIIIIKSEVSTFALLSYHAVDTSAGKAEWFFVSGGL